MKVTMISHASVPVEDGPVAILTDHDCLCEGRLCIKGDEAAAGNMWLISASIKWPSG